MSLYVVVDASCNRKTGPMPVVTASKETCPSDCPFIDNGCYAENAPLAWRWAEVEQKGMTFPQLLRRIRKFPRGSIWRYGQAGDLPNSEAEVIELAKANSGKKVIIYTHKRDFELYHHVQTYGVYVNLSASTVAEADALAHHGLPMTVVLPSEYARNDDETLRQYRDRIGGRLRLETPAGNPIAICPATYMDTDCKRCQVCATPRKGGVIIGFPAHGNRKKKVDSLVRSASWTKKSSRSSPISLRT